jgi:hypothetical protein
MKLTTRFDSTSDLRIHSIHGEVVFEELRTALTRLYESPEFKPDQNSLWDLREAKLETMSAEQARSISDLVRGHRGTTSAGRSALVVSEDLAFGMSRMIEMRLDGSHQVRVFWDLSEATSWLVAGGS